MTVQLFTVQHAAMFNCTEPAEVTCGKCSRSWCEKCDPAPSALCHWCNGRGYSKAAMRVTENVGSATINTCDMVDGLFAMEVTEVKNDNAYITLDTAEYLYAKLGDLLGKD